ncbi:MAG: CARDB domain-containing protein [Candidatus Thalassarchaeaceae archaeon]|nr:CARDB domain-containing protein [Candidatus Thalassarchaeaceae archaeon]
MVRYARAVALAGILFLTLLLTVQTSTPNQMGEEIDVSIEDSSTEEIVISQTSGRGNSDLIIYSVSASWTSTEAGETEYVSVRLKNQGTDSSGSFYWGIYLSTDTTITTNDIELDTYYKSSMSAGYTTSTMSKSVQIPSTITGGRYYVGALADVNSQVSESNENNNDDYDSGRVTIDELADLEGKSCSAPTTGVVGDYIDSTINIQIENDPGGNYIADSGSFYWAMYLSTDSTITSSDEQVGYDQSESSIYGGSYSGDTLSTSNRIPSSMNAGTYYWGFLIDVRTDVDEQSESNNAYTCSNQITIQDDLPDIVADDIDTSSSSAVMGDTITVNYRIENDGTDYTGSFYWELYLSTDRTITTNDIYVDEFSRSSISPGSYASGYQYSVLIPTGINPGYYYLGMIADSRSSVTELDETNNVVADTYRIDIEEPADLIVDTVSGPNSGNTGQQASLSWRIENDGDDSSGWFYWKAYISTDRTITSSDTQFGSTQQASSINGGSYRSGTLTANIPSGLSTRTYYWGIIVDTTDRVTEGDENNNAEDGNSISITLSEPDLRADSISVNSATRTICEGDSVTVDLSVSNIGNVNANAHYYDISFSTSGSFGTWTSIGQGNGPSGVASYTHQVSGNIPSTMGPGNYYAQLYTDYGDYITESNEYNNDVTTSTAELTVQDCTPELRPTALSGPTSALSGQTITLSYSIENTGLGEANNFPVDMFLSSDPTITTSDTHLGADSISVGASSSFSDTLSVTVPSNVNAGCWYYGIIVDMNNVIIEQNENDNSLAAANQVCILQPNLRVVSVSSPGPSTLGQSIEISVVVENSGGANAGRHQLGISLEVVQPNGQPDIFVEEINITSLAANTNIEMTRTIQLPTSPSGTYRILAVVDYLGVISESDESDNEASGTSFDVTSPSNDLLAKWITGPTSAEPGQTISVQWELQNLGTDGKSFDIEVWLSQDKNVDSSDNKIVAISVLNLAGGTSSTDETTYQLTDSDNGTWWLILVVDSSNNHLEDDEGNNMVSSANQLVVSGDAPEPVSETSGGCADPATDGNNSDAAGSRASATQLGLDVEAITIQGCLMGIDNEDWYAIMLHGGKRLGVSLENNGEDVNIILFNGTIEIDNGSLSSDLLRVDLMLTNEDDVNTSRIYHIRVSKESIANGGPYVLKIVTVDANVVPDLAPPEKPLFAPLDQWHGGNNVEVNWSVVEDNGESGLSHYQIRWAGGLWSDVNSTSTVLNISMLNDGRHSLEVRAIDNAGNPSSADAMWIRIDRTAPTLDIEQLSAQYAGPPVLEIDVQVSDGDGSGISSVEWSWNNQTWQVMPAGNTIIWSNWSEIDLYVKATDNVGMVVIENLTIDPPANPNQPTVDNSGSDVESSGGPSTMGVATIILIALVVAAMLGGGLYLIFRGNSAGEDDEEDDEEQQKEPEGESLVIQEPALATQATHVNSHEWLPVGGTYDSTTGTTWYILPDGNKWWMQEDGSFVLYQSVEEITPENHLISEEHGMQ